MHADLINSMPRMRGKVSAGCFSLWRPIVAISIMQVKTLKFATC